LKIKRISLLLFILMFIFILLTAFFLLKDMFIVTNINVERNFDLDNKKLIEFLGITEKKYIWQYDVSDMENKLSKDVNLLNYSITKKYPDSLLIKLEIRIPLASIKGKDGNLFFIDMDGMVFSRYKINYRIPMIVYNKEISYGKEDEINIKDTLDSLNLAKENEKSTYYSISEIEIIKENSNLSDFIVIFGKNNNRIYLKNYINVDLLKKGLICSIYLNENEISDRNVFYSGSGFVY
jgi:hypothetical protein